MPKLPMWLRVVIAIQIAIPSVALALTPAPYGFQMYAGTGWTRVEVTYTNGFSEEILPTKFVATYRGEIDWTRNLPEHMCAANADLVRVEVTRWHEERTHACR